MAVESRDCGGLRPRTEEGLFCMLDARAADIGTAADGSAIGTDATVLCLRSDERRPGI